MSEPMPNQLDLIRAEVREMEDKAMELVEDFNRTKDPESLLESIEWRLQAEAVRRMAGLRQREQ